MLGRKEPASGYDRANAASARKDVARGKLSKLFVVAIRAGVEDAVRLHIERRDDLDAAVLDAYGWGDLLPLLHIANGSQAKSIVSSPLPPLIATREAAKIAFDEAILEHLVALNAERAAEEARGLVHWLRPNFQNPNVQIAPQQAEIDTDTDETVAAKPTVAVKPTPWPKGAVDRYARSHRFSPPARCH